MRFLLIASICVSSGFAADQPGPPKSLTQELFGPITYTRAGASTLWGESLNRPEEWGRGADGVGRRFAANYGRHLISASVRYGVAEALHEDDRYFPAQERSFGGRLKHALLSTVIARNRDTEDSTPAVGRISGAFAGAAISRMWLPERNHTVHSALYAAGLSLSFDAGYNVFREFWPKRRHLREASAIR